jgi:hypothetical protein
LIARGEPSKLGGPPLRRSIAARQASVKLERGKAARGQQGAGVEQAQIGGVGGRRSGLGHSGPPVTITTLFSSPLNDTASLLALALTGSSVVRLSYA